MIAPVLNAAKSLCRLTVADFPPQKASVVTCPYAARKIRGIVVSGVSQDPHTSKQCPAVLKTQTPVYNDTYRRQRCRNSSSQWPQSPWSHRYPLVQNSPSPSPSTLPPSPFRWNPLTPASTSNHVLTKPGRAVGPAHGCGNGLSLQKWGLPC